MKNHMRERKVNQYHANVNTDELKNDSDDKIDDKFDKNQSMTKNHENHGDTDSDSRTIAASSVLLLRLNQNTTFSKFSS